VTFCKCSEFSQEILIGQSRARHYHREGIGKKQKYSRGQLEGASVTARQGTVAPAPAGYANGLLVRSMCNNETCTCNHIVLSSICRVHMRGHGFG